jgi:hypothetical protein
LSVIVDKVQQLSAMGDRHVKILQALLRRVCMNEFVPSSALAPLFDSMYNQNGNVKAVRVLFYVIGVVLGCGSAGSFPENRLSLSFVHRLR